MKSLKKSLVGTAYFTYYYLNGHGRTEVTRDILTQKEKVTRGWSTKERGRTGG
jgi:hypothetical protein